MNKQFAICGAGIAGLTTAVALHQKGIYPLVFEAAPAISPVGAGLGLAANAIKAFKAIGLDQQVISAGQFLNAMNIYDHHGKMLTRTDSRKISEKYGQDNFCIHRADLHKLLLSQIDPDYIQTHKKLEKPEQSGSSMILNFTDGTSFKTDYLIAADGINSVVRQHLLPEIAPRYAGYTCWRAVIENPLPGYTDAAEYWGPAGRFGLVPLKDHQLYWFCCINATRNNPAMKQMTSQKLLAHFSNYPSEIIQVLEHSANASLIWGDITDLPLLKNYAFGNTVLIGDAAHATTPNMGQGACQAIEDAVVLAQEISKADDPAAAFKAFEKRRMKRTQEIVRNSATLGKVAQWENRMLISIRNGLFSILPEKFNEIQLQKLYNVDFES